MKQTYNKLIKKGFTLAEVIITMAVLAIFLAVTVPLFTLSKNLTGLDKDATACVSSGTFNINSASCVAALSKCERNQGNTCNTLLNLVSTHSESALTVIGKACLNSGKEACNILINRCIENSANCNVDSKNYYLAAATVDPDDKIYDINHFLTMDNYTTSLSPTEADARNLMYNLLKTKMDLGVSHISDMVETACYAISGTTTMACSLLGHKAYSFKPQDASDFTEMDSEYGTIFKSSGVQLTNDSWTKRYGAGAKKLAVANGYIYITGLETSDTFGTADIYVLKVDASNGNVVWKKHYGGSGYDVGFAIAVSGSYVYVTGSESSDGGQDAFIMKIDISNGAAVWKKQYGSSAADQGESIIISGNYIYVVGDAIGESFGSYDIFAMQVDLLTGNCIWKKHYGTSTFDFAYSAALSPDGSGLYVVGSYSSSDAYVMRLSTTDGTAVWKKRYGGAAGDVARSIVLSADGNYAYVAGDQSSDAASTNPDIFVQKINTSDGTVVWVKHYGGTDYEFAFSILRSGNYLYVGGSTGADNFGGGADMLLMKLNEYDGTVVWQDHYGRASIDSRIYSMGLLNEYIYVFSEYAVISKINTTKTSSNIGNFWTDNGVPMGTKWTLNGTDITTSVNAPNVAWVTGGSFTASGTGKDYATWTNGVDIKSVDNTANSAWITGGAGTTGGTGADLGAAFDGEVPSDAPSYYYISTKTDINDIKSKIISTAINQTIGNATVDIKYLVSFDGGSIWRKWDGDSWEPVDTSWGLNSYAVANIGNTRVETIAGLTNYTLPAHCTSLDFLIYLSTTDYRYTPSLQGIDIRYN